jgi:lipopolysaccharide/colanic/teichoic acid biosynthesis glycosyltransferase
MTYASTAAAGSLSAASGAKSRPAKPLGGLVKRSFDICFAALALLACLPIFVVIACLVRIASPGPIFFRHTRIGFDGVPFKCTKFRTMHVDSAAQLAAHLAANPAARAEYAEFRKLKDDPRIIPFIGAFLRKSSLDELPQFFDVLTGNMSVVGPRPVTEEELGLYGSARRIYKACRPGVTGLWQVSGRNELSFEQRVEIDKSYVRGWSFRKDLWIIVKTIKVVACREGAC